MDHFEEIKEFVRHAEGGLYLSRLSRGFMSSRIFLTSLELGIFSHIGTGQLQASEVAQGLHSDERATEVLLNAVAGMGLLRKTGNLYSNIKEVSAYLDPGSQDYKGGSFFHDAALWDAWTRLTEIVMAGKSAGNGGANIQGQRLAGAMQEQASAKAAVVAKSVNCAGNTRMLDMGGGPGSYSIAFADRYPLLTVDLFDRDSDALKIAGGDILRRGLQNRINIIRGDFLADDFGQGYDIILISSILCILGRDQNISLLCKIKDALADGGCIMVLDIDIDESGTSPVEAAIFSVNMIVTTPYGRLYSEAEIREWLHETGFSNVVKIPVAHSLCLLAEK